MTPELVTLQVQLMDTDDGPSQFLTDDHDRYLEVEFIDDLMALRQEDVGAFEHIWCLVERLLEARLRRSIPA